MVERYGGLAGGIVPADDGPWVRYSDYMVMEADRDFWKERFHVEARARIEAEALSRTGAVKVKALVNSLLDLRDLIMRGKRCVTDTGPAVKPVIELAAVHILDDAANALEALSALEPAAPEGQQEAVETRIAWEALECIVARADASKLSPIQYEAAEVAAKIARNALEARGEISPVDFPSGLFPNRPAEQAVTEAAWQSQDLIESVSYVSKNFGLVRYEGIDRYFGQSTHKFSTGHGARYVLPEALNDFLSPKPVARPSEQALTEAMVEAMVHSIARQVAKRDGYVGQCDARKVRIDGEFIPRAALKAAMEAGRHD